MEEKAALQAELASVLGLLARAPLVPSAGTTGAAPATDTGSDDLVVRQLNDKVGAAVCVGGGGPGGHGTCRKGWDDNTHGSCF